jgi:hypothetical protein
MSRLVWDPVGERRYETGVDRGVVYPQVGGAYPSGEAWNGLISVTKSPSGAEATALWANNRKYANLISAEELGFSIEAFMYPDSFAACNGETEAVAGVYVNQQKRTPFGFTYRTMIGNDTEGTKAGYKISLIYGAYAGPSEDADTTINDSPEAKTMSWECTTTPVDMAGFEPTSLIEIDSTKLDEAQLTNLAALEAVLYGSEDAEARLPMPDEVVSIMKGDAAG